MSPKAKKTTLVIILLTLIICNQVDITIALIGDYNYEAAPTPSTRPDSYNNSVFLKEIILEVRFDAENASVNASYTFKNNHSTSTQLEIYFPFSTQPRLISFLQDGLDIIDYSWIKYTPESFIGSKVFNMTMCVNFSFSPYEEKVIQIEYIRNYSIYDSNIHWIMFYAYHYSLGTATFWNHIIDSASFTFRIPKKIFPVNEYPPNSSYGNKLIKEEGDYIVATTQFNDWQPIIIDGMSMDWDKDKPFLERILYDVVTHIPELLFLISILGIIIILIVYVVRTKELP